jgi:hypothetical protein
VAGARGRLACVAERGGGGTDAMHMWRICESRGSSTGKESGAWAG